MELGGGGQPYEVYLQVLELLAARWASVAVGVSVHVLSCFPLASAGTPLQQQTWLPDMLGGELLGAYCLSEPQAGSDPAAMTTRAAHSDNGYLLHGTKAWTTHGGQADFYTVMARTSDHRSQGISCFLVPADTAGLSADPPERKMGLTGSATATMRFDDAYVDSERLLGGTGRGLAIALAGLDAGRLGIAAVATGLAQGALDDAVKRKVMELRPFNVWIRATAVVEGEFPNGGYCLIEVMDDGPGIPTRIRDLLFTPLAMSTTPGGTGIGTRFVKSVANAHHGQVGVESELGHGARIWMKLPLKQPETAQESV